MLVFSQDWTQGSPFNDYCPTVRSWGLVGKKKTANAGCVPLAISKIFTYFEYPQVLLYNGIYVNWNNLKTDYNQAKASAAALLRSVGQNCHSAYFYDGTFTFPTLAKSYMKDLYFANVNYGDYDTDLVVSMLDNNKPVFICSIPKLSFNGLQNSHGWNIDGYKTETIEREKKYYVNGILKRTEYVELDPIIHVHCDFGWGGSCNGYYTSGVFDLNGDDVDFDINGDAGSDVNYEWYLKIITYDQPQI